MFRLTVWLLLLCAGCVAAQPESAQTVAAVEVPLPTPSDKSAFLELLRKEAERNGYHVDAASEAERAHPSEVSPITFGAAVWRGNDDEPIASATDFRDHVGHVWLVFSLGEDPDSSHRFRDALVPQVEQRWADTTTVRIMPNGAIPLATDVTRTASRYDVNPTAAAIYQAVAAER